MDTDKKISPKLITVFNIIFIVLIITPALLCLLFIVLYGVNVVYWDQWEIVNLLDKLHTNTISFTDLVKQHNEHRVVFPLLAMLGLAEITHYNNLAEMCVSWLLICLSCFVLLRLYLRSVKASIFNLVGFIPVSWMLFSVVQWENLLWGFQLCVFILELFLVLSIYLLATAKGFDYRFFLSLICGYICSFTILQGLMIWPTGLMQIILMGLAQPVKSRRSIIQAGVIWLMAAIIACVLYFIGYVQPPNQPMPLAFLQNPSLDFGYLIAYGLSVFGSALSLNIYMAIPVAILLCVITIYIIYIVIRNKIKIATEAIPYYGLVIFGLLCIGLLMAGRSVYGLESGGSSRYTTITLISISGIYLALISINNFHLKFHSFFEGMLIGLIALGLMVTYGYNFVVTGNKVQSERQIGAYILATAKIQSNDNLSKIYPVPDVVRQRVDILIKNNMNVFKRSSVSLAGLVPIYEQTAYYVDSVNGRPITLVQTENAASQLQEQQKAKTVINSDIEKTFTMAGWAVDSRAQKAASNVYITIDGHIDIPTLYGLDRPDVAAHFSNTGYTKSGFIASFETLSLLKGKHVLTLKIISADGRAYYAPVPGIILEIN